MIFKRLKSVLSPAPPPLRLRAATESDCAAILQVHLAALRELTRGYYAGTRLPEWAGRLKAADYLAPIATNHFLVAEAAGRVEGFADFESGSGELIALFVHPRHAGRGTGTLLLRAVERQAAAGGCRTISLLAAVPAVPFYQKSGFIAADPIVHDLGDGLELRCVPMSRDTGSDR